MGDELRWQSWIFDMYILDRIDRELQSLKCLDLKFGLSSSEFFRLFQQNTLCVQAFYSVLLCPDIFIHGILKLRRHLDTETYGRVAMAIL